MSDIDRKAKELLAYECPECGGENGHESEDGWLRCSRCSNPHDVTRHQAMQAIIAALTPPEGFVLVPFKPTEAMVKAVYPLHYFTYLGPELRENWERMLAARPEVK